MEPPAGIRFRLLPARILCAFRLAAGLGVGLSLDLDPGVSLADQLGHRQQVVEAEAVGFLPGVVALLVAAGWDMTLYQLPLSPVLRQIVTCRTPSRILCAGFDMMILLSLWFPAPTIEGLTRATRQPPKPGSCPRAAPSGTVSAATRKTEGSRLGKNECL